jgi:hypothetical protein
MQAEPIDLAELARDFVRDVFKPVVDLFRGIARDFGRGATFCVGYFAAHNNQARDWSMPDDWHRGYLAGSLALVKAQRERSRELQQQFAEPTPADDATKV